MAHIDLNIPNEEYHKDKAVSKSKLSIAAISMEHYYDKYEGPDAEGEGEEDVAGSEGAKGEQAKFIGNAIHTAILEPDEWESRYLIVPKMDKRTTQGKADFEHFTAVCKEEKKQMISEEMAYVCIGVRRKILAHPLLGRMIRDNPLKEVSFFWNDKESGIDMRARLDLLALTNGLILDVKSARDTEQSAFERAIAAFKYHFQPAVYGMAIRELLGCDLAGFLYASVEKTRPFGVRVFALDEISTTAGNNHVRKLLNQIAECRASGKWPGYPPEVQMIGLPRWALAQYGIFQTVKEG